MTMLDCNVLNLCGSIDNTLTEPPIISVYDEALEMLSAALTIYIFADLRDMARSGSISISLQDLEPPMAVGKILEQIMVNKDSLTSSGDYDDLEQRLTTLEHLYRNMSGPIKNIFGKSEGSQLVHFVDTNAHQEMVHGITVNKLRKRVCVVFRGSVTKSDFVTDAKVVQIKVGNPVFQLDGKYPETINVHSGFYNYLFKVNSETGKSRLETILDDVRQLLGQNPGYRLYCTGHSLGAALSTLCGFYAAADDSIVNVSNGPVRVVSVASPYVGNIKFLLAFQALERAKRLQHLRIANAEDVVTLLPIAAPKLGSLSPLYATKKGVGNLYKHCGMKLRLISTGENCSNHPYSITYPQDQNCDEKYAKEVASVFEDGKNFFEALKLVVKRDFKTVKMYHSCEEYEARLQLHKNDLSNVTIDDLYRNKEIVGDVLDEGYEPKVILSPAERVSKLMNTEIVL